MKKSILILLSLVSLSSFAAQDLPWPEGLPCGRHTGLTLDGELNAPITQYNWYQRTFQEQIDMMAVLLGKPGMKLSFEYIQYRFGYQVMKRDIDYATDCQHLPEQDEDTKRLLELQKTRPLTKEDFKGPNWIHMVNALDKEEVNCLAMSKINGVIAGCGDVWQGGASDDNVVCFEGKNYMKCHVECIEKIYDRDLDIQPGFCK